MSIFVLSSLSASVAFAKEEKAGFKQEINIKGIDKRIKVQDLYRDAYHLIDDGRFKKARQKLETLLELDPDFPRAYLELARIEMKTNWPKGLQKAEKLILIAKSLDENLADTNILLGYVYTNLEKFQKAETLYLQAEEVGTDNLWLYANRGLNFQKQNKPQEAIIEYLKVTNSEHLELRKNFNVAFWVFRYSDLYKMMVQENKLEEADGLYEKNHTIINFTPSGKRVLYDQCVFMRQAKHRLYYLENADDAISSISKARDIGCDKNGELLSIAYYVKWSELKKEGVDLTAANIALRKAQAFSPDDNKLITALLETDKTKLLIKEIEGLDINSSSSDGITALSNQVATMAYKNVEFLLQAGADPNKKEVSDHIMSHPLIISGINRDEKMIKLLIKYGADPNENFRDGYTVKDVLLQYGIDKSLFN